ncbi:hypothetical protein SEA_GILGAMESH_12 [Streptomyces phage Gilgamesh]|uniref:Uncharacterized protein n=1 Tax=Streptomyces phage Gilgamesh TaxID=2599890 RepID=A0A5J6TT20_9CAUD|nr:hypothetical protein QEH35_gp012 [Streptomyces phage Gilgamesh]QFG13204.1 hypothetical protein SEA_GILGAMESH_12 [Streptomyces phage Gilgamesh]
MKGILHLVASGSLDPRTGRWMHPCEVQAVRVDETAWAEAWQRVRPVIAWQAWPEELARDWLGIDSPAPPPLPENVRELLKKARPLLGTRS